MKNTVHSPKKALQSSDLQTVSEPKIRKRKTFEAHQKMGPSALAEIAFQEAFWVDAPQTPTSSANIEHFLYNDVAVRLQIAGFRSFLVKSIENSKHRNGSWLLVAIYAINRQDEEMGGAYLVEPSQMSKWVLTLLRNSDRYMIRRFNIQFPKDDSAAKTPNKPSLSNILSKEIPSLAFLDIPIEPILKKEIKSLSFLDKKVF